MSTIVQRSFSGGEIAPSLYARVDVVKYATGLRTCRNFFIRKHGGASNRPGTRFVAEVKDSSKQITFIQFEFNTDQTYVLEFGDLYMRVHRNGAPVTVSGVAAYAGGTAYSIGDLVVSAGINYYCIQAGTGHTPASSPTYWYALTDDIYEIPTPYVEADLPLLKYDQSADVITITHPTYPVRELRRTGDTAWTLPVVTFAPAIAAPTGVAVSGAAGTVAYWVVTAVDAVSFEESLVSAEVGGDSIGSSGAPRTISWSLVSGAGEYNVYRKRNGVYQLIGVAVGTSFVDDGITPDENNTASVARNPFTGAGNYPATSAYFQGRHLFAGSNLFPERGEGSRSGNFKNFTRSSPLQDDDAITFNLPGRKSNVIKAMVDLGKMIVFTSGTEWLLNGDSNGVLRAGEINPVQQSYNGSGDLPPILIGSNVLYVQARGNVVRDLGFELEIDGYRGNDLTIFSNHLVEGFTLENWAYSQIPNSVVWITRSDGTLLGLTYVREHQIFAWHRHDFSGGFVENVCVVPEDQEDAVYLCIRRVIGGQTVRYIERMETRTVSDIKDALFMDSALTYDGRNTDSTKTMTLSGGTTWDHYEDITLEANASFFVSGDVGNEIHLENPDDGSILRCEITEYTSGTVVTVRPDRDVPVSMRGVAISDWGKAVDEISGLDHLEGEYLSVFADGFVVGSPNNDSYIPLVVASGSVALDRPYVVINAGLPYTSDIETLDIDTPNGESVADKKKNITQLTVYVEATRGAFIGSEPPSDDDEDPLEGLYEYKIDDEVSYDEPLQLTTGQITLTLQAGWNSNGRIFIRQVDPLPISVLAVYPAGLVPFTGR